MNYRPSLSGLLLLLFGFFLIVKNSWALATYQSSYFWPTTSGTVVQSHFTHDPGQERIVDWENTKVRVSTTELFRLHFSVRYEVEGEVYKTGRINLYNASIFAGKSEVEKITSQYRVGQEVIVYYDLNAPETAVLERGGDPEISRKLLPIFLGLFCIGFVGRLMFSKNPMLNSIFIQMPSQSEHNTHPN